MTTHRDTVLFHAEPLSWRTEKGVYALTQDIQDLRENALREPEALARSLISKYTLRVAKLKAGEAETHVHDERTALVHPPGPQDGDAPGASVRFYVPYEGEQVWFTLAPARPTADKVVAELRPQSLVFALKEADPVSIQAEYERMLAVISANLASLEADVAAYHRELQATVWSRLAERRHGKAAPVRQGPEVSRHRVPALRDEQRAKLLSVCRRAARGLELNPGLVASKDTYGFRCHLRAQLDSAYQGQGGGEAFARDAAAGVRLRTAGRDLFVAECACWEGRTHFETLLARVLSGPLWGEARVALIILNYGPPERLLEAIPRLVRGQPGFIRALSVDRGNEFHYLLEIGPEGHRVTLVVLVVRLPRVTPEATGTLLGQAKPSS